MRSRFPSSMRAYSRSRWCAISASPFSCGSCLATAASKSSRERALAARAMAAMASMSGPAWRMPNLLAIRLDTSPGVSFSTLHSAMYLRHDSAEPWLAWSYASNACTTRGNGTN